MARDNARATAHRTAKAARLDAAAIRELPALISTSEAASIIGTTPLYVSNRCAKGAYQAVKCGREWRISKARFLQDVGLL